MAEATLGAYLPVVADGAAGAVHRPHLDAGHDPRRVYGACPGLVVPRVVDRSRPRLEDHRRARLGSNRPPR